MPIDAVVKLNGRYITFFGFEIDTYAEGTVSSFNDGILSKKNILISFGVSPNIKENTYSNFIKNQTDQLTSDMASLKPLNLLVDYIRIW
jgi:hypothetical protein